MKKFYVDIDVNKRELYNARPVNLASAPSLPGSGQFYFDTTLGVIRGYTGSKWVSLNGDKPGNIDATGMAIYESANNSNITFDLSNLTVDREVVLEIADTDIIRFTKDVWDSTLDPSVADDSDSGYSAGSHWLNTISKRLYICTDASVGAAIWSETTNYSKSYKNTFTTTSTLNLTHNLGTMDLVYKIYKDNGDGTYSEFIPDTFKILNVNQIQVTFSPATAGKIAIVGVE